MKKHPTRKRQASHHAEPDTELVMGIDVMDIKWIEDALDWINSGMWNGMPPGGCIMLTQKKARLIAQEAQRRTKRIKARLQKIRVEAQKLGVEVGYIV